MQLQVKEESEEEKHINSRGELLKILLDILTSSRDTNRKTIKYVRIR